MPAAACEREALCPPSHRRGDETPEILDCSCPRTQSSGSFGVVSERVGVGSWLVCSPSGSPLTSAWCSCECWKSADSPGSNHERKNRSAASGVPSAATARGSSSRGRRRSSTSEAVSVGDRDLALLEDFPPARIGGLYLGENRVTDDGLRKIGRLTNISVLGLGPRPDFPKVRTPITGKGARITDEGLFALKPLSKVFMLGLQGTPIGDAGLENLRGVGRDHNGLLVLSLAGTLVTDAGLARLPDLFPNLDWLELDGCAITDEGLTHLGRLGRLSQLFLNDTRVGDEGLRLLVDLQKLNRLQLDRTRITDQGLDSLKVLKGPLGFVSLRGTVTTAAKRLELQQAAIETSTPLSDGRREGQEHGSSRNETRPSHAF